MKPVDVEVDRWLVPFEHGPIEPRAVVFLGHEGEVAKKGFAYLLPSAFGGDVQVFELERAAQGQFRGRVLEAENNPRKFRAFQSTYEQLRMTNGIRCEQGRSKDAYVEKLKKYKAIPTTSAGLSGVPAKASSTCACFFSKIFLRS